MLLILIKLLFIFPTVFAFRRVIATKEKIYLLVPNCPQNESEWKDRASQWNCTTAENMYHCLRTTNNKLIEVCLVIKSVGKGKCLTIDISIPGEFNEISENCSDLEGCPQEQYVISDNLYKYPSCLQTFNRSTLENPNTKHNVTDEVTGTVLHLEKYTFSTEPRYSEPNNRRNVFPTLHQLLVVVAGSMILVCLTVGSIFHKQTKKIRRSDARHQKCRNNKDFNNGSNVSVNNGEDIYAEINEDPATCSTRIRGNDCAQLQSPCSLIHKQSEGNQSSFNNPYFSLEIHNTIAEASPEDICVAENESQKLNEDINANDDMADEMDNGLLSDGCDAYYTLENDITYEVPVESLHNVVDSVEESREEILRTSLHDNNSEITSSEETSQMEICDGVTV